MICLHLRLKLKLVQIVNLESFILKCLNGIAFAFLLMGECHELTTGPMCLIGLRKLIVAR